MKTVTIKARSKAEAIKICREQYGWTPDTVREVESGDTGRAWKCFESAADAELWDKQR